MRTRKTKHVVKLNVFNPWNVFVNYSIMKNIWMSIVYEKGVLQQSQSRPFSVIFYLINCFVFITPLCKLFLNWSQYRGFYYSTFLVLLHSKTLLSVIVLIKNCTYENMPSTNTPNLWHVLVYGYSVFDICEIVQQNEKITYQQIILEN